MDPMGMNPESTEKKQPGCKNGQSFHLEEPDQPGTRWYLKGGWQKKQLK